MDRRDIVDLGRPGGITVVEFENETPVSVAVAHVEPSVLYSRSWPATEAVGIKETKVESA